MLIYDPNTRISAEGALNHLWIKKKVNEVNDPKVTFNALQNLRTFRVNYILFINYRLSKKCNKLQLHSLLVNWLQKTKFQNYKKHLNN